MRTELPPYAEFIAPLRDAFQALVIAAEKVERPHTMASNAKNWTELGQTFDAEDAYHKDTADASNGIEDVRAALNRARNEYRDKAKELLKSGVALPESVWGEFRTETWVKKAPKHLKFSAEHQTQQKQAANSFSEAEAQSLPAPS